MWVVYNSEKKEDISVDKPAIVSLPDIEESDETPDTPPEVEMENWCHSSSSLEAYQWPIEDTEAPSNLNSPQLSRTDSIQFSDLDVSVDWESVERMNAEVSVPSSVEKSKVRGPYI